MLDLSTIIAHNGLDTFIKSLNEFEFQADIRMMSLQSKESIH